MTDPARDLLDAKLALEAELARPLYRAGLDYIAAWEGIGGNLGSFEKLGHLSRIQAILTRHYARVTMVMQGRRPPKDPTLADACRSNQHLQSLADQAHRNAQLILASLDRELARDMMADPGLYSPDDDVVDDGMSKAWGLDEIETKDAGDPKTRVTGVTAGYVGRIKSTVLETIRKWKQKISGVVIGNTNPQAEEARHEDAKTPPVEIVPDSQATGRLVKVWNSLLDGRERDTHHAAHGQEVGIADPFTVGGALLRFPGDASMGAPLRERINCRCYVTTVHVADDGTRTPIHTGPSAPTRRYGRKPDGTPPVLKPTSVVTLNGATRARVVLGDGQTFATLRQTSPSTVEVLVNRRVVGRAQVTDGRVANVTVDRTSPKTWDVDGLIRRSVEHSRTMDRTPHAQRR